MIIIAIVILLWFVGSVLYLTGRLSGSQAVILGISAVVFPVIIASSIRRWLGSWGLLAELESNVPESGQAEGSVPLPEREPGVEMKARAPDQTRPASAVHPPLCRQRARHSSSFASFHLPSREPRPVELVTTSSGDRR